MKGLFEFITKYLMLYEIKVNTLFTITLEDKGAVVPSLLNKGMIVTYRPDQ